MVIVISSISFPLVISLVHLFLHTPKCDITHNMHSTCGLQNINFLYACVCFNFVFFCNVLYYYYIWIFTIFGNIHIYIYILLWTSILGHWFLNFLKFLFEVQLSYNVVLKCIAKIFNYIFFQILSLYMYYKNIEYISPCYATSPR